MSKDQVVLLGRIAPPYGVCDSFGIKALDGMAFEVCGRVFILQVLELVHSTGWSLAFTNRTFEKVVELAIFILYFNIRLEKAIDW